MTDIEPVRKHLSQSGAQESHAEIPVKQPRLIIGWDTIDSASGSDDDTTPPEIRAELARTESRMAIATSAVDTILPQLSLDEQYQIVAQNVHKSVGELDASEKANALRTFQRNQFARSGFAREIARGPIAEHEMVEYASRMYTLVQILTPSDQDIPYQRLSEFVKGTETLENAKLFQQFAHEWKEKFLQNTDEQTAKFRLQDFQWIIHDLAGTSERPRPEIRSQQEMNELFESFLDLYEVAYQLGADKRDLSRTLIGGAKSLGLHRHSAEEVKRMLLVFREASSQLPTKLLETFMDDVARYSVHHGLSQTTAKGFLQNILPAMIANNPEVAILQRRGNVWGMQVGDFGIADFVCHAYVSRISPSHLNELFMALREAPTTSTARIEQNRLDALTLAAPFGILRDFIHDQRPHVHDVVSAMIQYYDTGSDMQLTTILNRVDPSYFGYSENRASLFTRDKYETKTEERRADGNPHHEKVRPIDVLRRLEVNTRPVDEIPPTTSDTTLNRLLQTLYRHQNTISLQKAFDHVNTMLMESINRHSIGIEPTMIVALAWLEQRGFRAVQKLVYEDQMFTGVHKQPWFHALLRFQELTASPTEFNKEDFEQFLSQVSSALSPQDAYGLIFQRLIGHLGSLARKYKEAGRNNRAEALWSGNIAHELIGLTDLHRAQTSQGNRHRQEALLPEHLKLRGE